MLTREMSRRMMTTDQLTIVRRDVEEEIHKMIAERDRLEQLRRQKLREPGSEAAIKDIDRTLGLFAPKLEGKRRELINIDKYIKAKQKKGGWQHHTYKKRKTPK